MQPTFLRQLSEPSIRTVLICGCGGGFDFIHGMLLYPELRRLGGGSDSLMAGDEEGLGDVVEDAVPLTAVADLKRPSPS